MCYFCPAKKSEFLSRLQPIYDIAEICAQHGIANVVLCPGSRCAPLTLAFTSHAKITCRTMSDERSAAFVALGMAQQTRLPTALVCTSGSAAYNFAPAVAEAFFQHIPLLVFTADRPSEWIDQWDGQTIRQQNIFGLHVKAAFQLPEDYAHPDAVWHIHRTANEAISLTQRFPAGPVHVNVPLREPLYPAKGEKITFGAVRVVHNQEAALHLTERTQAALMQRLQQYSKVMVMAGQQDHQPGLVKVVEKFCKAHQATLVGDIISNFHGSESTIRHADVFLAQCGDSIQKSLSPELLITFGKSIISKNTKLFLRNHKSIEHWHVLPTGEVPDTFQSLTSVVCCEPKSFFESLSHQKNEGFLAQKKENYTRLWQAEEDRMQRSSAGYFDGSFNEFQVIKQVMDALPTRCNLHLANSMAVRYANMIGLSVQQKGAHVFANRGTSGIDGCTSTTVGHALTSDIPNILITGDLAFFYDRNAFWHNYAVPHLRVVLVNNHGGIIFNMIDGPANLEQSAEYFVTHQKLTATHMAQEFGIEHIALDSPKKTKNSLKDFFEFDGKTKILEVTSNQTIAKEAFNQYKSIIKKGYAT
ncbi:MAG: 2-succinyl-5-enolpyruvyl-6-hydroxy-3-cyclohexene-1-carboxylic-acid synthase [Cytophagales bacterium]